MGKITREIKTVINALRVAAQVAQRPGLKMYSGQKNAKTIFAV